MRRIARNANRKDFDKYGRNEANVEVGAGPLRPRGILQETYGVCQACHSRRKERLFGGLCDWCRWMQNDTEAGEG